MVRRAIQSQFGQGRWHVVNGIMIQPDMNLPRGDSSLRQVLLRKPYMREKLYAEATIAYCVDSFGHADGLPPIICAMRSAI